MKITSAGGITTYDSNPSRNELIETYTKEVKAGLHLANLLNALLDEFANRISLETNSSSAEIKDAIYRKAGEYTVVSQGHTFLE